jgi:hypothetical protein
MHSTTSRVLTITSRAGDNAYIRLTDHLDLFDEACIGGSSYASRAAKLIELDWGGSEPAITDIDGTKQIFRSRAWVKPFFELFQLKAGDELLLEKLGPSQFRLRPRF